MIEAHVAKGLDQRARKIVERLQRIVIGDSRFTQLGFRTEGGFVGTHDRRTHEPVPAHIRAKAEDFPSLMEGLIAYDQRVRQAGVDAVVVAAALAFGFVYIHPFEDGNGRLHRWLIHYTLAVAGYNPPGVVFPVGAAIYRELASYKSVLESFLRRRDSLSASIATSSPIL
jgi:Fic family protein